MTTLQPRHYLQLDHHLAQNHPLTLTCPDLHWAIGSSFKTHEARAHLKTIATFTIAIATWLNPEAQLAIIVLRLCFAILQNLK
ncbi:MAG: hypothetical protein HC795_16040 [Coleofasciculaceae cyanobacterium RL_1_1]|nr:hypothetical protein [Coleofasciculaceae cyanobacterium RL_1_1]